MTDPDSCKVVDLVEYRKELGEARQRVQIQQSLHRLARIDFTDVSHCAIQACERECLEKGIDISKEGFIQDMKTLEYLMQGALERNIALETDNVLMLGAIRLNIQDMLEVESGGKG